MFSADYYRLVEEKWFCLWDYMWLENPKRNQVFTSFCSFVGIEFDNMYDFIESKVERVRKPLIKEYKQTEEYKTSKKHDGIITAHRKAKKEFEEKYGTCTYDMCYTVFGELWNTKKLEQIKAIYKTKQKYKEQYSNYYNNNSYSNSNYDYSSLFSATSAYTDKEKDMLKTIYKRMATVFHPDNKNGDEGIMKFINSKLKNEWGI
ncbi:hypothetical protein [Vallitalea guaymasensis]|uniref:J domain-containing protein n=1 Tax=Vallitalea guaymasensis TaxID=1185412 RepID=A0A8J8SCN1_9FIRM|nr:hypothetical protein [Vallitalea guaymasensis]QUH29605.1 hypothetical protein HYG85_12095 [Vallitalea guaymasensis]